MRAFWIADVTGEKPRPRVETSIVVCTVRTAAIFLGGVPKASRREIDAGWLRTPARSYHRAVSNVGGPRERLRAARLALLERLPPSARGLLDALSAHQRSHTAQALAFDFFLALIPMLALAGWAGARLLEGHAALGPEISLFGGVPEQIRSFLEETIHALAGADVAPVALVSGVWLSSSAFATFLSIARAERHPARSPLVTRLLAIGLAIVGLLVLALASSVGVFLLLDAFGVLGRFLPLVETPWFLRTTLVLLGLTVTTTFIALLYRATFGAASAGFALWRGALAASLLGSTGSLLLVVLSTRFGNHALFYGGLAAVVALLLWLWVWSWALLVGAQLAVGRLDDDESASGSPTSPQRATSFDDERGTQTPRSSGKPAGA